MAKPFIRLFSVVAISCITSIVSAQTPAPNFMPDGSHDLYVGLGVQLRPRYEGAGDTRTVALPVAQLQWSNGIFVAGTSLGIHLFDQTRYEFGPLVEVMGPRSPSGSKKLFGDIGVITSSGGNTTVAPDGTITVVLPGRPGTPPKNKLLGLDNIRTRLLYGGFFHFNFSDQIRLTNTLLYGAGNDADGLRWVSDLRYQIPSFAQHHHVSIAAGVSVVNQAYNQAFFGVTALESRRSGNRAYSASAGVKDIHADLHWNWALSSSWLLTSSINVTRLTGSAADSPLVERRSNASVSSAIAYRF
jgi:MipA family protein